MRKFRDLEGDGLVPIAPAILFIVPGWRADFSQEMPPLGFVRNQLPVEMFGVPVDDKGL